MNLTTNNFIESKNAQLKFYFNNRQPLFNALEGIPRLFMIYNKQYKCASAPAYNDFYYLVQKGKIIEALDTINDISFDKSEKVFDLAHVNQMFIRKVDNKSVYIHFFVRFRSMINKGLFKDFKLDTDFARLFKIIMDTKVEDFDDDRTTVFLDD